VEEFTTQGMGKQVQGCDKMGKNNMPPEQKKSPLTVQYQAIDADYRRDIAIVEARPLVLRIALTLWGLLDVGLIALFLIVVLGYLISGSFEDSRSMARLGDNVAGFHAITEAQQPIDFQIAPAKVLGGAGRYDLFSRVANTNENWSATFSYHYSYDGGETDPQSGFLNPNETREVPALAVESSGTPRNARMIIENVMWNRVDRHAVPSVDAYLENHNNFPISNIIYSNNIGLGTTVNVGQTDFTLANRTSYSYWEPKFLVFLERGTTTLAVTEITVPRFVSSESRSINVRWLDAIPASATIRVVPVINYQDESLYMKPQE
jgi:hypothetical protein